MDEDLKLKARDKLVQRMTRDGLVEENLSEKSVRRVSDRLKEADFSALGKTNDVVVSNPGSDKVPEFFKKRYAKQFRDSESNITVEVIPDDNDLYFAESEVHSHWDDPYAEMLGIEPGTDPEDYVPRHSKEYIDSNKPGKDNTRKQKIKKQQVYSKQAKQKKTALQFDDEKPVKEKSSNSFIPSSVITTEVIRQGSKVISDSVSEENDDNAGKDALNTAGDAGRTSARFVERKVSKTTDSVKKPRLDTKNDKPVSRLHFEETEAEPVVESFKVSKASKQAQKKQIQKGYAAKVREAKRKGEEITAATDMVSGNSVIARLSNGARNFFRKSKAAIATLAICGVIVMMFISGMGTLGSMISETGGAIVESTFLSSDDDILDSNAVYLNMESALQRQVDGIERTYPGYDEYRYVVDEISHEPYALISYLTAKYGDFRLADIQSELTYLFQEQFRLRVYDEVEIKTRTVTRTGTREVIDEETGETFIETYRYEEEEEYEWHVLNVKLTNKGVDSIAMKELGEDQGRQYLIYLSTLGNRSYLFGDILTAGNPAGGGISYEIPPEALNDERFANMIREAEKYLGYPYVWGGSSPDTSFDCSGFVSWVINHCGNGWNVGRLGASGLLGVCIYVSPEEAKPGDLIFFHGTYNTDAPASHVAIYVGNGMMIHCGDPIQYTSINSNYWQQHFYCFGRIN